MSDNRINRASVQRIIDEQQHHINNLLKSNEDRQRRLQINKDKMEHLNRFLLNDGDPTTSNISSPLTLSNTSSQQIRLSNYDDQIMAFCELAQTVNVNLPYDFAKNIITLIRLGVPPDDVFVFMRECLNLSRFQKVPINKTT